MPAVHDFICDICGAKEFDVLVPSTFIHHKCSCGEPMEIAWNGRKRPYIGIHPWDRSVIWYNPKTGRRATPGRNDVPMPKRYKDLGYERREFTTLRELDAHCKENNLVNEAGNYNSNGHSYDEE